MNVLITGNLGYLGPCVVQRLRTSGTADKIAGLDAGYFKDCLLDASVIPDAAVDLQIGADVRHVPVEMLRGADAVIHLAGISNDPIGNMFEDVTAEVNYEATVELARKARMAGARAFVFASSCGVYGCAEDGVRSELSAVNPYTAYAKTKLRAEWGLMDLASRNFVVTCTRFASVCGVSPRLRLDRVLNDFVGSATMNREIRVQSDGSPWRPLVNVRDVARALDWAIQRPSVEGGAFLQVNIGSNKWNYRVCDLAEAVAAVIPGTAIHVNPDAQPDHRSYQVSFDLFEQLAPKHQPVEGLERTVDDLRWALERAGARRPGFRKDRFNRLKTLVGLIDRDELRADLTWSKKGSKQAVA